MKAWLSARLMADIGKPDVVRFMGSMDEKFIRQYPSEALAHPYRDRR